MHTAHQRAAWDQTACAIAVHCQGVNPMDLNPYRKSRRKDAYDSRAIEAEYERLVARDKRRMAAAGSRGGS